MSPVFISDYPQPTAAPTAKERQRLALAHQGLVRKEAYRWAALSREPLEDLMQEGQIGLIKAIDNYSPGRGLFCRYAARCIRGQIQHYLRDKGWGAMKPPRTWIEKTAKVRKTAKVTGESEAKVAAKFGLTEQVWAQMLSSRQKVAPLSADFEGEGATESEEYQTINAGVDRLKEPIRTCIVEFYFHRVGVRQLARQQGCTQKQIKSYLTEGIAALRADLAAMDG